MIPLNCHNCKNYIDNALCAAFPLGIPEEIFNGDNPHTEPLPDQENNIVFEPVNDLSE